MGGPDEPFDELAVQKADENKAHDIVSEHAPPFAARSPEPPTNANDPLTPEEKRALFAQFFPVRPSPELDQDKKKDEPERER